MRWMSVASLLGAVVTAAILGSAGDGAAQAAKIPPDFVFEQGKESPGPVTFSHERHKAKVEKCTACHVKIFKMKKGQSGPLTMEKMKAGQQCGACHDGKTRAGTTVVFAVAEEANCAKCHKK